MQANIDGKIRFEQIGIEAGSWSRESYDRAVAGLDGIVSVDMGGRKRKITQKVILRSTSKGLLDNYVDSLAGNIDGQEHVLTVGDDMVYEHLRVDSVTVGDIRRDGAGISRTVKIEYTQLRK